jgi:flavin reductase (DIM6/NTAB) family NADH-FMN oxidoreductase RutF
MTDKPSLPADQARKAFDEALRLIPAPVTVLGVRQGEELGGLTAAWVTRVSLEPPLMLVSVGHERRSWDLMQGAQQFTISVLAEGQVKEARLFGLYSRRDRDKWAEVDHVLLGEGVPALEHCTARYLCRVQDVFRTGDHDCVVGHVELAEKVSGAPALPMRGADYAPGED